MFRRSKFNIYVMERDSTYKLRIQDGILQNEELTQTINDGSREDWGKV